ncbi:cytochrome P450 [Nocardia sp. CDC159]|uniref:Cytochrome P450 n=1 Tax=Nocardia pulmonis TaxID=2951408 RepID=A0A9X2IZS6_9NOCA|nr:MULTISPECIES: cytochrome P450 [Nocardia]MCM6777009.1 cytochrome P450 [Nocardia pulmonis]MCM6789433.1 cytochrome P450 [Nocardia sp. CDC159]
MNGGTRARERPRIPRAAPLHALWAGLDFDRYFRWRSERDGDPFFVRFPGFGSALFTGTRSGAMELFRAPVEILTPPRPNPIEPLVGSSSLILTGAQRHRRDRSLLTPAFHRDRIRHYGRLVRDSVHAELDSRGGRAWRPGARVDARAAARAITLRVISAAVFGIDDSARRAACAAAVADFLTAFSGPLLLVPALRRSVFGHGPWDRFLTARARLDALIDAEITDRRASGRTGEDLLGMLLRARADDGAAITDVDLREQLRTLLVAGHETTATSLVWALYRLHREPATLLRLRAELARAGSGLEPDELSRLPYLDAVCQETLRLHPPVPIVLRRLTEPYSFGGVALAAGATLGLAVPLLHSDPDIWARPADFAPERFLARRYGPFEYTPYGGGHRRCIGAPLADYELRITLATVLERVELTLSPRCARGRIPPAVPHNIATGPHAAITFDVGFVRSDNE